MFSGVASVMSPGFVPPVLPVLMLTVAPPDSAAVMRSTPSWELSAVAVKSGPPVDAGRAAAGDDRHVIGVEQPGSAYAGRRGKNGRLRDFQILLAGSFDETTVARERTALGADAAV